jgi:translocation protein SEC62
MAERRKNPNARPYEKVPMNPTEPMSKFQRAVTDWLKRSVPTKKTRFLHSHMVDYFIGRKAVDLLLTESPWAKCNNMAGEAGTTPPPLPSGHRVLETREEATELMDALLRHKMFHRAKKIPVTEEKKTSRRGGGAATAAKERSTDSDEPEREREPAETERDPTPPASGHKESRVEATENRNSQDGSEATTAAAAAAAEGGEGKDNEAKKKRKIRLDMHLDQVFLDCADAYVWLYDPIPWYYWLGGTAIVLVLIAFCLFPLWPRSLRRGAHWIVFLAACFMVGVLGLALVKYALFALLYGLSGAKLRFWLLPNLTEDVGFVRSFWPLYAYKYTGQVVREEEEEGEGGTQQACRGEESDSNESNRSAFEIVEKSKDD